MWSSRDGGSREAAVGIYYRAGVRLGDCIWRRGEDLQFTNDFFTSTSPCNSGSNLDVFHLKTKVHLKSHLSWFCSFRLAFPHLCSSQLTLAVWQKPDTIKLLQHQEHSREFHPALSFCFLQKASEASRAAESLSCFQRLYDSSLPQTHCPFC